MGEVRVAALDGAVYARSMGASDGGRWGGWEGVEM